MSTTTYWSPNQAAIAQVETYTFSAPAGIGSTYTATINGKSVTYTSVSGDTAALAATGLFNLLNVSDSIAPELTEIVFANPLSATLTATARNPGTPFANVTGGSSSGLVMSTGGGLSNGIATTHTTANSSPSDVNDPQNWMRVLSSGVSSRSLPQNGDDVIVGLSTVPMLWNLDQLALVQFNTYRRLQSMTGDIGLPTTNPGGYTEWRATDFKFSGPQGSVPAGGLPIILGEGSGNGPGREQYALGSQPYTLTALGAGSPEDVYGIYIKGVHTNNTIIALNGVSIGVATRFGETSNLNSLLIGNGASVTCGSGVTWTSTTGGAASSFTANSGTGVLNSVPATVAVSNGSGMTFSTDALVWPSITAQGGCTLTWLAGGTITALTMSNSCSLDKSGDARALTITNHTIDGDTCFINDPLNAITYTNAGTVKQSVTSGPYHFTGTKTVKVT